MHPSRTLIVALFLALAAIWGFTWPLYVVALRSFSPFLIAGLRNVVGAAVLLGYLRVSGVPLRLRPSQFLFLAVLGLIWIAIPYAMVFWAVQFAGSGIASVLNGTNPFWVAIFSLFLLPGERMTASKLIGLLLGFAGVVTIFWNKIGTGSETLLTADLVLAMSALFTGLAMVIAKRFGSSYHSALLIAAMMFSGGSALVILSLLIEQPVRWIPSLESFGVLLYLSVLSSAFGFAAYMWLLKRVDAVKLSMVAFLVPVIAIAAGMLLLREAVAVNEFAGTVVVFSGLFVVFHPFAGRERPELLRTKEPA